MSQKIPTEFPNYEALLNYSKSYDGKGDNWFVDAVSNPAQKPLKNFDLDPKIVKIFDLRGNESFVTLDATGFMLARSPTRMNGDDLLSSDTDAIKIGYYQEIQKLIKDLTCANEGVIFDHTVRIGGDLGVNSQPHFRVHGDQTPKSAMDRASLHASRISSYKRMQILNVWRPIGEKVWDCPLALLDYRSLNHESDLVATELRFPSWLKDKESYSVKYNENHKWYFWNGMSLDEILVFKCFDSLQEEGMATLCVHSAFKFGECKVVKRKSIEVRALVFYI